MAYLLTDAAKGSDAAMTMMENMGGMPLAQDVGQAKAEQVIANTQKTKLANLVAETGIKDSENSRTKLQELQLDPKFQEAVEAQDYGAVLRMQAATQMMANDVEGGSKRLIAAETFDAKKIANEQKQLDLDAQTAGNAYAIVAAVPDDKIDDFISRLPAEKQKVLIDKVGAENWAAMSGVEKKEATKNLMLNAKGQMAVQLKQVELQKQELINQSRERIAFIRENAITSRRLSGADDRDMRDWNIYTRAQENIERSGRKTAEKLDAAVEAADLAMTKSKIGTFFDSSKPTADTEAAYNSAVKARDDFRRSQVQKELNLAISAPDFPGKKSVVDNLTTELELYGKPPAPEKPKAEPKPTVPAKPTGKEVPSNTYTETSPAKPVSKEDYDKLPAGSYYMQDGVLKRKKG